MRQASERFGSTHVARGQLVQSKLGISDGLQLSRTDRATISPVRLLSFNLQRVVVGSLILFVSGRKEIRSRRGLSEIKTGRDLLLLSICNRASGCLGDEPIPILIAGDCNQVLSGRTMAW